MKSISSSSFGGRIFLRILLCGVLLFSLGGMAKATTYYWDVNGSGVGSGVSATAHTWAASFFTTDPTGDTGTSSSNTGNTIFPGSTDDVIFSAGTDATIAYTANLATASSISVQGLTLNANSTGSLTIGPTSGTLTIGADGVTVNGSTATSGNVLTISTGATTGGLIISTAETWSNTSTAVGGVIYTPTNITINGLWTLGSGTFFLGVNGGGAKTDTGSGGVRINGGSVTFASSSGAPGSGTFGTGTLELSSGSLQMVAGGSGAASLANVLKIDGSFTFGTGGGAASGIIYTGGGTISNSPTLTFNDTASTGGSRFTTNNITLDSNVIFNGVGVATFSSALLDDGGTRSVTYSGSGTLNLNGPNTYAGGTSITSGTVSVGNSSGSATGTGGVALGAATLRGTGTVSGLVTASGASGSSNITVATTSSTGTLTLNGGVTSSTGLTLNLAIDGAAGANSLLSLGSSNLTVTGGTLTFNLYDLNTPTNLLTPNTPYTIMSGTDVTASSASSIVVNLLNSTQYTLNTSYGTGGVLISGDMATFEVEAGSVPEPSTYAMLLGGLGLLLLLQRLRSRDFAFLA